MLSWIVKERRRRTDEDDQVHSQGYGLNKQGRRNVSRRLGINTSEANRFPKSVLYCWIIILNKSTSNELLRQR
jgi:hypothetical protein